MSQKLEKRTIRFIEGDIDKIAKFFPKKGYNVAIRELVHSTVKALEERLNEKIAESNDVDLDLEELTDGNTPD
jgi:hypothetical protein